MARIRSARKKEAPFRTASRKMSTLPASLRICPPSLAIRRAICFSLNAFLIRFFNGNLVQLAAAVADFEGLGDLDARQQHDLSSPEQQRNAIAGLARDFTINQE